MTASLELKSKTLQEASAVGNILCVIYLSTLLVWTQFLAERDVMLADKN
jgi:hypothetical protein